MNIAKKKSLPRRTVLRGLGVALGLPFLDAMFPAFSAIAKAASKPLHRFQAVYAPNGMAMEYWTPSGEGANFAFSPILQPLAPFRDQLLVLSGLDASWRHTHSGASASFLTGTRRGGETETEILASTSMDQILARQFGSETQLASLELSMEDAGSAGQCSGGLSCAYTQTISWRTPTLPLPMEYNPQAVFERLFGDAGVDPTARLRRRQESKSILDSVIGELTDLKRELGAQDTVKIDEYTQAVRDVERRIQKAEEQNGISLPFAEEPSGPPPKFEDHLSLMFDLQRLAFQADLTRVITFMLGREQSARAYPEIGVPEAHHPLSHHQNVPDRVSQMSKINAYHTRLFSDYLAKLRTTPDGDGSLLDHMTIIYGAGISNSTAHSGDDLPILVVGGAAGRLKGGRHLRYPAHTPAANLLVTLMDKLDVPVESLGNSTDKLPIDTLSGL